MNLWRPVKISNASRRWLIGIAVITIIVIGLAAYFLASRPRRIEGARILVIVAEGFDYHEYAGVTGILNREGATITTASFTKEWIPGKHGGCKPDLTFDEVNVSLYDVIYIPGGKGPYNIITSPESWKVYEIISEANERGKIIAAICHGPWVLAGADIVRGKSVTCWSDQKMINDLKAHGAVVDTGKSVVRDGNIITARGPKAINALAEEIIVAIQEMRG